MTNYNLPIQRFINIDRISQKILLCVLASAILAVSAWVSLPIGPVPVSLQSLAVLVIGGLLGSRLGSMAVVLYLLEGAIGLPVFAGGQGGMAALFSATFGFKLAFIPAAFIAGLAVEKGMDKKFWYALPLFALAHQIIFVGGVLWLAAFIGFEKAFAVGYLPFMGIDVIKFTAAAFAIYCFRHSVNYFKK